MSRDGGKYPALRHLQAAQGIQLCKASVKKALRPDCFVRVERLDKAAVFCYNNFRCQIWRRKYAGVVQW